MLENVWVDKLDGRKWRFERTETHTLVEVEWGLNTLRFRWENEKVDELGTVLHDWMTVDLDKDLAPIVNRVV